MLDDGQFERIYRILVESEGIEKTEEVIESLDYILESRDSRIFPFVSYQQELISRVQSQNDFMKERIEENTILTLSCFLLLMVSAFINIFYIIKQF